MTGNIIPDDWDGVTFDCAIVNWPSSPLWKAIFNGLMTSPSRGRFWDGDTGSVTDAQEIGEEIIALNYQTNLEDFVGCTEISEQLSLILAQMGAVGSGGGCGCGSSGGPSESPEARTDDFGDPTAPSGTPPVGYASWPEYQAKKCDIATWIVDNLLADIIWIQTLDIAILTGGVLVAGLLAFLSGGVILFILASLLIILGYDVAILANAQDAIEDDYDDLICALFSAETAQDSIDDFGDAIDTAIDAETADTIARVLLKALLKYWVDTPSVNLLYAPAAEVDNKQIPTGGDCSACGVCTWQTVWGTGTIKTDGTDFTITSEDRGGVSTRYK